MATGELLTDDDQVVEVEGGGMTHFNREEIDMQIATAKRYPRSVKQFRQEVSDMACLDEETAASMFYALPRGGKKIEGPSARFAEVVGAAYGNLRYGARITGTEGNFVVAEGVCFDTQKNVSATVHVKRRITNSEGHRFNDDMIQVTGNAACSIALRNAIFKVVPMGLVKDIFEKAKLTSIGKASSLNESRHKMLEWFAKAGAPQDLVLESLGREGVEDVTTDDLVLLRGLVTAIKDGEVTIETAFDQVAKKRGVSRSSIDDEIKKPPKKNGQSKPKGGAKKSGKSDNTPTDRDQRFASYQERIEAAETAADAGEVLAEADGDEALTKDNKAELAAMAQGAGA